MQKNREDTKTKNDYYKNQIDNANSDMKKIYKIITDATNGHVNINNKNIQIFNAANVPFNNEKNMVDYSNKYFTNIGLDMFNNILNPSNPESISTNINISSMYLKPVTQNELIKHINNLKNNTSPGEDGISTEVIKHIHEYILTPLEHIINLIFKSGKVPKHLKSSVIIPIHKSGSKNDIKNYRPISLINNFAKIFEKCLKERLINFFEQNNTLSQNQYGFKKDHSTADAMCELTGTITKLLDNNKKCIAVFLDLAKAFDTVPHNRLLDVLWHYGVRGPAYNVLNSYLTNRTQYVKINNTVSNSQKVKIGVPQGTVLGPILFNTYINDLTNIKIKGKVISYADDTVIIFSGDSWQMAQKQVQEDMQKVKNWLDTFKLSLNITKTKYIAFSITMANRPNFNTIKIKNLSEEIKETDCIKYLGILVDKHLKWDNQLKYLTKKVRTLIHKFYILRDILNKKLLTIIYKNLVESILQYGISVWGGAYESTMKQLKTAQNSIIKVMYKKQRLYPTNLLYTETDLCNIRTLYILAICTHINKNVNLENHIKHKYETRNKKNSNLELPVVNRNINLRSINYFAPKIYNTLPLNIKKIKNKKKYRQECLAFIKNNYEKFSELLKTFKICT